MEGGGLFLNYYGRSFRIMHYQDRLGNKLDKLILAVE